MALDPLYMNFASNLAGGFLQNREVQVNNAAINVQNQIVKLQAQEQQGYAAINYAATLTDIHEAEMSNSIAKIQALGAATVEASFNGTDQTNADLQLARDAGKTQSEIDEANKYAKINHKQERKAIKAQEVTGTRLQTQQQGILSQVFVAGSSTYFDALKSGLIK